MKIIMTKIFIKRFLRFILRIFYCLNLRVYTNILIGEKMNEKEIIRGLKRKDERILSAFIEEYAGLMKNVISDRLKVFPNIWEEVLNDSIFAVWENINSYNEKKSSFKNWCASIARYKAIDALRKELRHKSCELDDNLHIKDDRILNLLLIEEIFNYLSAEDKMIFEKIFLEGRTYDELSNELSVSKDILYSRVKRARKNLKDEFER